MKKKILLVGNSIKEYALTKFMSRNCDVYIAPGNDAINEFAQCVDIRANSTQELLDFALENSIDMTIPISADALNTDIVELFFKNNLPIFAPSKEAMRIVFDKVYAKKTMYKLHIPTPKFGIFEKQSMANDYIKNINQPYVLKTNDSQSAVILTSQKSSKPILDSIFSEQYKKVIIEDYVYGSPFAFYSITDGYKSLPIGSSIMYKHTLEGDGGQLTSGMGACSPNYKLSFENEDFIMNNVIYPVIEYLENVGSPYSGILGVNGIISEDGNISVLGFNNFMQDSDCANILSLLDTDLYNLFESCIIGSFSDEIEFVPQKNKFASSVVLQCRNKSNNENVIHGLESIDENTIMSFSNKVIKNRYLELEAKSGADIVVTALGRTLASSVERVYDEVSCIDFNGIKYRKDIGKTVLY